MTLQPWVEQTADLLRSNGFNTLGCWSSWEQFRGQPRPIPYTTQWNFLRRFAARSGRIVSPARDPDSPGPLVVLFDPGFEAFCDEHARQLAATRDDPWLLGHFSDNELPFQVNLLEEFLQLPGDHSAHRMAEVWLAGRRSGKPLRGVSIGDREAFREHVVRHYFRIVSEAIRKHDPNHLFLGSRFHGRALRQEAVFRGCARLVDVVSVNYYHAWTPSRQQTQRWVSESGRPFLVTEWYAKGMDRGLLNKGGAGWVVRTQEDRGRFYQHFVLGLLRDPACVGWHWFRYQDNGAARDGGTSNKGLVDLEYKPYAALEAAMRELNTQAYHLSDHLQQDALPAGQEGGAE